MRHNLTIATIAVVALIAGAPTWSTAAASEPRSRTAPDGELDFPLISFPESDESTDVVIIDAEADEDAPPRGEEDARGIDSPGADDSAPIEKAKDAPAEEPADESESTDTSAAHAPDPDPSAHIASESHSADLAPLSPRLASLRDKLRATLGYYHQKRLNTRDHNPWEVMHSIVAYGASSHLNRNGPDGPPVNAISWLCWNGECHGTPILEVTGGRVAARKGPQVQGHPGQFLAILAQGGIATSCPIKVGAKHFTLDDLIESEKLGCQAGTELTFKLISFSYYLDIRERWKNAAGQDWSIDRLVHEELSQPIVGAPCGGTHRLMGLAYAVRKREASGLPVSGEFRRAKKYLDDYHRYTLTRLQNTDGSFSTEWFKSPGARPDLGRRIQTSGHILEWLSYSLPAEVLLEDRMIKAVEYLTGVLSDDKGNEWEVGPLGHALHSLAIYDSRVFKPHDQQSLPAILAADRARSDADPAAERNPVPQSSQPAVKAAAQRVTRSTARPQTSRAKSQPQAKHP